MSKRPAAPRKLVAVAIVIFSGLVVSCSNNGTFTTQPPTSIAPSTAGTGTPSPSATDHRAEIRVPTDLINKTVDDARAQLSAAGISFTTSTKEAEGTQVGRVLEVDPVGGTVLSQGGSVRLVVGKAKESPPSDPLRPGDLSITDIKFSRIGGSANCYLDVTAFNNLRRNAEGITVLGHLQMRDQSNTRITLDFSRRNGLETLDPQEHHQFHGDVTFLRGVTASYQIQIVQGSTVIDQVSEQVATCS